MTVQAERPVGAVAEVRPRRRKRPVVAAFVVIAIVAAAAVTFGIRGHSGHVPPNPVLGQSLQPLPAYRVETSATIGDAHAATKFVPDLGRPGHTTLLDSSPTFSLHVQYAHVRQVAGHWQLMLVAPEGRTYNVKTTQGQFYNVLVHGQAVPLFFVAGTEAPGPDHGTNFAFGAAASSLTRSDAVALAHTLTSSVLVD